MKSRAAHLLWNRCLKLTQAAASDLRVHEVGDRKGCQQGADADQAEAE